ncbi:SbcC/MukB-like Walker B domain-containing protein, partial [Weissella soli]
GLEINVIDYAAGGVQRSTTTLSGGESFMAALAIALSLAEVVQNRAGGAKIEALFIDEGFGSLDNSTLAQAIEALRSVEAGGRLVGVISHVDAMKREIQQQLLVKKHGDGHSSIAYSLV